MPDFEAVYRQYFADVYKYALALSRDEQTAEEVTQETAASRRALPTGRTPGGSISCSTPCRSRTRKFSPCGPSANCPFPKSVSCSAKQRAGPG